MKKIAILMVLMMGLLALAGCSSDNESVMLDDYNLLANVETPDGNAANGATVEITSSDNKVNETKTADENGVVQFEKLVSDSYTLTANYDIYRAMDKITIRGNDTTAQVKLTDKLYLYSSEFGSSYEIIDWGSEAGLSEESIDGYDNVFKVESAGKWNIGIMAFVGLSDSYQSDYESISFKVKSEDLDQITVKIPEVESTYTIENGKDLGNGWYELTVPFSDFSGTSANADAIGIIGGSEAGQSFYITDVYFTSGATDEEDNEEENEEETATAVDLLTVSGNVLDIDSDFNVADTGWGANSTVDSTNYTEDETYTPAIKMTMGEGWGPAIACGLYFDAGTLSNENTLRFKIKAPHTAAGADMVEVQIEGAGTQDPAEKLVYDTDEGWSELENGWVQIEKDLTPYGDLSGAKNIVIIDKDAAVQEVLITDVQVN